MSHVFSSCRRAQVLFDKRTVLCAVFAGAPKLPPITFVRAPTLFVVETQYTPKRSDADHSLIRGRTIHRLKITGSAPEPASSRGSRVRKLKNEILCRIGARARHIRCFENRYKLQAQRRGSHSALNPPQEKAPQPYTTLRKRIGAGSLKLRLMPSSRPQTSRWS